MTVLGKAKNEIKCPICKHYYLKVYSEGEKYCPHCGRITDGKAEKPKGETTK